MDTIHFRSQDVVIDDDNTLGAEHIKVTADYFIYNVDPENFDASVEIRVCVEGLGYYCGIQGWATLDDLPIVADGIHDEEEVLDLIDEHDLIDDAYESFAIEFQKGIK